MSETENPNHRFRYRWDLAYEIGFLDRVRAPISEKSFAELCRTKWAIPFSVAAFREYNAQRARAACPRFLVIGGAIRPGKLAPIPFLTDGDNWMYPPEAGLFWDLATRVEIFVAPAPGVASAIYPVSLVDASETWVLPSWCVLHDSVEGIASVIQMRGAFSAVREANAVAS